MKGDVKSQRQRLKRRGKGKRRRKGKRIKTGEKRQPQELLFFARSFSFFFLLGASFQLDHSPIKASDGVAGLSPVPE